MARNNQVRRHSSELETLDTLDEACSPWALLRIAVMASALIPFFVLTPQAAPLLVVTTGLGGLALLRATASRFRYERALAFVLAAMAGTAWAALPVLLYGPAQGEARLVLLAAMIGVAAAAPSGRAGQIFVLPAIAGGIWAVLAAGGAGGIVLALVQIAVGLPLLTARRPVLQPVDAAAAQTRRVATDDIVNFLLDGAKSHACEWLWATDEHLRLRGDLDRFAAIAGVPTLAGDLLTSLYAHDRLGAAAIAYAMSAREPFHDLIVEVSSAGRPLSEWRLSGTPEFDDRGHFVGYHGFGADLSALRHAQARIAHLATHDALTGLANRETFQARAVPACEAAATGSAPLALLFLDLDGFKQVNDDLGHAVGDELLAALASVLTRVSPKDATVARLGGDEFAILFSPAAASSPETLAQTIIRAVSAPFVLGAHQAQIGVSIGIALSPEHAIVPRDLARKADLALYRAKQSGRGRHVVFVEAFEREREERLRLEADIALALERGEFALHYQPLLDLAAGRIAACEALIRWTSPTRGMVPPVAFIPAAEGTGLIVAIGRFVLAQACRDAASWPLPATVAVNISPQHLRSPDFKADVQAALKASGLPPSRLEVEITEGVFLDKSNASLDALIWLRERGIKLALDDFGTGFSSLSYLVDFPVDKIKIDRSFVTGMIGSPQSRAVVDAILTLARTLGVRVVAEGVETREQALALKLRRCDDLQGYLICRPQPADAIGRLLVDLPVSLHASVPALLESSLAAALAMKRSA